MRVDVLLFANLAELVGTRSVSVELRPDSTVADMLDELEDMHPVLQPWRSKLAVAVDGRYARPETIIQPNQDIALIPPVSGG